MYKQSPDRERMPMTIYDFAKKYDRRDLSPESIKMKEVLNMPREHTMEKVAKYRGITFINDSKCSNVNSLWYALETVGPNTILIMGGMDKGNDYSLVMDLVKEKVKAIVCIGVNNSNIRKAFQSVLPVYAAENMIDAIDLCLSIAKRCDNVFLSPACASFDRFKNYEDRGNQFKHAVKYYS